MIVYTLNDTIDIINIDLEPITIYIDDNIVKVQHESTTVVALNIDKVLINGAHIGTCKLKVVEKDNVSEYKLESNVNVTLHTSGVSHVIDFKKV